MTGIERDVLIYECWKARAYPSKRHANAALKDGERAFPCVLPGGHYHIAKATG